MKKFRECLGEHAMKIVNFQKKKMIPLTNKQPEPSEITQNLLHLQQNFEHKYNDDKNYRKVDEYCHYNRSNFT